MHQAGGVARLAWQAMPNKLTLGAEVGVASGDKAPGFGNDPSQLAADGTLPEAGALEGPQYGRGGDHSLDNLRFNPGYRVDLVLWREILGQVTDAWYVKPSLKWEVVSGLTYTGALVYSQAVYGTSTPSATSTAAGERPLGLELDNSLAYAADDGFHAWRRLRPALPPRGLRRQRLAHPRPRGAGRPGHPLLASPVRMTAQRQRGRGPSPAPPSPGRPIRACVAPLRLHPGRRGALRRGHQGQPGPRHHAGRPGDRPQGGGPPARGGPRRGAGRVRRRDNRLRPGAGGRPHPRGAPPRRAHRQGRRLPPRRPEPQRPGGARRAALHRRRLRRLRRRARRACRGRSSARRAATSGRCSPATPTSSGPSRSPWPTTSSPTSRCSAATGPGSPR